MPVSPRISVVIPVFNGARHLRETLESACRQTSAVFEVIVVDDGSTDGTAAVIADSDWTAVKGLRQEHAGCGPARNRGARAATGEWLAFLDSDDLWLPEKLAWQIEAWRQTPEADLVFGHIVEFLSPELPPAEALGLRPRLDPKPGLIATTLLMRRDRFLQSGGFAADLRMGEFIDWYSAITAAGARTLVVPQVVGRRRIHAANMGRTNQPDRSEYARVLKRALDRRRMAGG